MKIHNMEKSEIKKFLSKANYRHVKKRRIKLKEELVKYKGGKCEICGYNKCIAALEFHHLNKEEKDFTISSYSNLSIDKLKSEVDKCILVCANCHREIHQKENEEKKEIIEKQEQEIFSEILNAREEYDVKHVKNSYKYLEHTDIFRDMENKIKRKDILKKYHISNETFNKFLKENNIFYGQKKVFVKNPSKDELEKLLSDNSKASIARMFGVSWSTVHKWCKKYNIR